MHLPLQTPLLHLCTVACGRIAPCGKKCGPEQSYRGARGASPPRLVTTLMPDGGRAFSTSGRSGEISRPRYGYLSRYAVASTRRVAASTPTGGSGCGAAGRGRGGAPKSWGSQERGSEVRVFHTLITHRKSATGNFRQPRTVSLLSSVPSRLQSPKSSERAQSPISRRAPSTGARVPVPVCGRGWVVRCPCFNFKFTVLNRYRAVGGAEYFAPSVSCERGPRARCERKKRTRWPTPDS